MLSRLLSQRQNEFRLDAALSFESSWDALTEARLKTGSDTKSEHEEIDNTYSRLKPEKVELISRNLQILQCIVFQDIELQSDIHRKVF